MHVRGLNDWGDYGYVIEETVWFFIKQSKPITKYVASSVGDDGEVSITKCTLDAGHCLHFRDMAMQKHLEKTEKYFDWDDQRDPLVKVYSA